MSSNAKFGDIGEIHVDGETLSLQPSTSALRFIVVFGSLFIPAAVILVGWFSEGPEKWFSIIGVTICGGGTFGVIYWIIKSNIDRGPYIQFQGTSNQILLPRLGLGFEFNDVEYLQLITGRSKTLPDVQMNLNLVIRENNQLYRYLVMPSPYRAYVLEFAKLSKIEVREVKLGSKGCRDDSLAPTRQTSNTSSYCGWS